MYNKIIIKIPSLINYGQSFSESPLAFNHWDFPTLFIFFGFALDYDLIIDVVLQNLEAIALLLQFKRQRVFFESFSAGIFLLKSLREIQPVIPLAPIDSPFLIFIIRVKPETSPQSLNQSFADSPMLSLDTNTGQVAFTPFQWHYDGRRPRPKLERGLSGDGRKGLGFGMEVVLEFLHDGDFVGGPIQSLEEGFNKLILGGDPEEEEVEKVMGYAGLLEESLEV